MTKTFFLSKCLSAAVLGLALPAASLADCLLCETLIPVSILAQIESGDADEAPGLPMIEDETVQDQVDGTPRRSAVPS